MPKRRAKATQRPPRKATKPTPRPKSVSKPVKATTSGDAKKAVAALQKFDAAHRAAYERGEALVALAEGLRTAATKRVLEEMVRSLVAAEILRDIADLDETLKELGQDLPQKLVPFRLFPREMVKWFEQRLGLVTDRQAGEVLEVESERLERFEVHGDVPETGLVRVEVLSPGWTREGRLVVRPRVRVQRPADAGSRQSSEGP